MFDVYSATSPDLASWQTQTRLLRRASMPKLYTNTLGGVLVLYEANTVGVGPSVAAAWFPTVAAVLAGAAPDFSFVSQRTLSGFAEGTPNLFEATGSSPMRSEVAVGMHYFKNGSIDQQAVGVLVNFKTWVASDVVIVNRWMARSGVKGKVGSRSRFSFRGQVWEALEAQHFLDDWSSWRVFLGDGLGFVETSPTTAHGSSSFANPFVRQLPAYERGSEDVAWRAVGAADALRRESDSAAGAAGAAVTAHVSTGGRDQYVATVFVPSEGAGVGEAGEMLWVFEV